MCMLAGKSLFQEGLWAMILVYNKAHHSCFGLILKEKKKKSLNAIIS